MILYIVSESDQPLVIQAETGIVVVKDKDPFPLLVEIGKEHVLRPLVHHTEQLGDKVVGDQVIKVEMIPNLVLEFIQVVLGGYDPRGNGHELLRLAGTRLVLGVDSVIVRIAGLEVVRPVRPGKSADLKRQRSEVLFENSQLSSPSENPKVSAVDLSLLKLYLPTNSSVSLAVSRWKMAIG